jgi:hypothetical protein
MGGVNVKKLFSMFIIFTMVIPIFAASSFEFYGMMPTFIPNLTNYFTTFYSQEVGNLYLLETIGTGGAGGAIGFSNTSIDRQKVGFLNLMVGKTTYAVAIGANLNPFVPAAYFEYDTIRTIAPIFYDMQFTAGNYGLPAFGVTLDGRAQIELAEFSMYAQEHFKLIFGTALDTLANVDLSYKDLKGSLFFTDEVGNLYSFTGGWAFNKIGLSVDVGMGMNQMNGENIYSPVFGLSSAKSSMGSNWMVRYMMPSGTNTTPAFYLIYADEQNQFTFGYNMGAVYLSIEN